MKGDWSIVPLGDVLNLAIDSVQVEPNNSYKISGVYSFGRGLLARGPLLGTETTYKVFHRLHENDFVISHLKAWEGALARVTKPFDGWFLSPQFSTFQPDPNRLEISYLEWYCKQSKVWEELRSKARGMGARRDSVLPSKFLALSIPLPSLDEQRRIVARIEELAARIEEARELRRRAQEDSNSLWESCLRVTFKRLYESYPKKTFRDFCSVVRGGSPRPAGSPIFYDGPIPFLKVADLTMDDEKYVNAFTATIKAAGLSRSRYVKSNTLMLTNSGATLGVPKICKFETCFNDGIQAFLDIPDNISKEYIYYFLRSKTHLFRDLIARGQGQPNLNTEMVKSMKIPLPSFQEQNNIVSFLDEIKVNLECFRRHQAETAAELDALLPAVLERAFRGEL